METLDTVYVIYNLVPDAQFMGVPGTTEAEYNVIVWYDDRDKPTWAEIVQYRERPSPFHSFDSGGRAWVWQEAEHIESRCDDVDALYLAKNEADMSYSGNDYQICAASKVLMAHRVIYATMSELDNVTFPWSSAYSVWRAADNTDVTFATAESYKIFGKAVSDHCNDLWGARCTHKDSLRALSTFESVRDYDITTGW